MAPNLLDKVAEGRGLSVAAARIRSTFAPRALPSVTEDDVPRSRVYKLRLSCSQKHPGLCLSRDAAIYRKVIAVAKAVEKVLGHDDVGCYLELSGGDGSEVPDVYVMLASSRERRPFAQQCRIFARYEATVDTSGGPRILTACHRLNDPTFEFGFVWSLVKPFVKSDTAVLNLRHGDQVEHDTESECMQALPNFIAACSHVGLDHLRRTNALIFGQPEILDLFGASPPIFLNGFPGPRGSPDL